MDRTYKSAVDLLNSRRRSLNPNWKWMQSENVNRMRKWLQLLGYSNTNLNRLNPIHIAGTKGKGSTCSFAASFLAAHSERTGFPQKIGLYTSPHLNCIRERIQINSTPISEQLFTKYFFEVLDGLLPPGRDRESLPRYLQFLALLSFHVFISEGVDVAIYETHSGGECDATNVIPNPVVTAVTTLGMDHIELLGDSIEDIAWHKAGIFKLGSPAFSTIQEPDATAVLKRRAAEKRVALYFVDIDPVLPENAEVLKPEVQKKNCSLALALVDAFLKECAPKEHKIMTQHDILRGIERVSLPGRFHQILDGTFQWFLDGAHNELSMLKGAQWFAESVKNNKSPSPCPRILIFSHVSRRDGTAILRCLARTLRDHDIQVQHVIFSTYERRQDGTSGTDSEIKGPEPSQQEYAQFWERNIDARTEIFLEPTVEAALRLARKIGDQQNGMQTFVTGSLHLVGAALYLLERDTPA